MEPATRVAGPSGVVVKNRSSSGCLIVRKKGDNLGGGVGGSSRTRKQYESKKVRKKLKVESSNSESSDGLLTRPARRIGPETIRVCNGLNALEQGMVGGGEITRKRERMEQIRRNGDDMVEESGLERRERKRSKLDIFDFDEYDGLGGGRFMGAMHAARSSIDREFETGSSRHIVDKNKNSYYDRASDLFIGDGVDHSRLKMNRNGAQRPLPLLREKFNSDESIRFQGKNGVLKVMVNKKKVAGPLEHHDHCKPVESNPPKKKAGESRRNLRAEGTAKRNVPFHPSSYVETKPVEKQGLLVRPEKKQFATRKSLSSKDSKGDEQVSDKSDTSLNLGMKNIEPRKSSKKITSEDEKTPVHEKLPATKMNEGKIKRGSGTEKQKLRERIREMLLNAGWTIDYRPRRNRDYLDAVYINPGGTAYWSIIKAYEALQKQLNDDDHEAKPKGESSSFAPIADDVLNQLTRKTRKKMEKELKKKQRDDSESDSGKELQRKRTASKKRDMNSLDTDSNEEKLSSFIKLGSKSMKTKMVENAFTSGSAKSQNTAHHSNARTEKSLSGNDPLLLHGRKSRKHGRCTLLVRSSNKGLDSESDDFVPYMGKRTVLSWLIDSGVVQLSQKVQYRRKKRVMLEGWITRDGIHCGCCSKILTVSKFELHAGSNKFPQPFQNICLDSGVSLLQCQIDAWGRQENAKKIRFHSVDIDGNDPNDDTCGICGDGGDLICCDGCPSTFHQSCLDIKMLPPGEWNCPNCTCKFCGLANRTIDREDDATVYDLHTCDLCNKKYHDCCTKDTGALPSNSIISGSSFCGKGCKELFEQLKKYLGTKHELDAGFTWSLIHRTDEDSEAASRGITQRVECNSKLAVALTVMDECFLPVVDRRSGINLIHNVLYNSGSNFSRLNYSGFYTAILERGDEIISAASIRFHGTKLAEMPFIGTRHMYRHQGMCRRLFSAIELALCSLKVEKLVIPAISELIHTWTTVFGFTHLEESLRQEMRSLNMLVFPGIDMLQKLLVEQGKLDGADEIENGDRIFIKPNMADRLPLDSSSLQDPHESDDAGSNPANEINNECSDASEELNNQNVVGRSPVCSKPHSEERLSDSISNDSDSPSNTSHEVIEKKNKVVSPANDNLHPSPKCQLISPNDISVTSPPLDAPDCHEVPVLGQETAFSDPDSAKKLVEPYSDRKCHAVTDMHPVSSEHDSSPVMDSQVADNTLSSKEVDMNYAHDDVLEAGPSVNLSQENLTKEMIENVDVSGPVINHAGESSLHVRPDLSSKKVDMNDDAHDNTLSSKEVDMNDAHDDVLESGPSVNLSQENLTKEKIENVDVSGSVINHAGETSLHVRPDLSSKEVDMSDAHDNTLSSKEAYMNDAHDDVLESGPSVNFSQENLTNEKIENVDVSGSVINHAGEISLHVRPDLSSKAVDMNNAHDNTLSSKVVDMNDAHDDNLESGPSVNLSQENLTNEKIENVDVSGSVIHHAGESSLHVRPDLSSKEVDMNDAHDNTLSSKEVDMNDTHDDVLEAGPSVNLSQENLTKEKIENVDVSGSVINHAGEGSLPVRPDLSSKEVDMNDAHDNTLSTKEVDMNDAHDDVLESGPSVNLSQENLSKEKIENVDVSGSVINHAGETSLHVRPDLNDGIADEGENNLHLDKEVALNEMNFHETGLNASGDSSEIDPVSENGGV